MPSSMLEEPVLEGSNWNVIQPWSIKLSFIKRLYRGLIEVVKGNTLSFRDVDFKVSHIFQEGKHYADQLASLGLSSTKVFKWYIGMPASISLDFHHNRFLFPMYRGS